MYMKNYFTRYILHMKLMVKRSIKKIKMYIYFV